MQDAWLAALGGRCKSVTPVTVLYAVIVILQRRVAISRSAGLFRLAFVHFPIRSIQSNEFSQQTAKLAALRSFCQDT